MRACESPTSEVRDDLGIAHPRPVRRVVSLVPSLTEAVAVTAPGLLVGATDWCSHPADLAVIRVRGTKNPDIAGVVALGPDLVLANSEENRAVDLDALRAAGLAVWVTSPRTVPEALDSLGRLLAGCNLDRPGWLDEASQAWAPGSTALATTGPRRNAVVPIWHKPWMALGRDTFAGDVLARLGIDNVLADDPERYPRISPPTVPAYDVVVLPDEPYAFTGSEWPVPATVRCVSGRHLTWYGPSLVEARTVLERQLRV